MADFIKDFFNPVCDAAKRHYQKADAEWRASQAQARTQAAVDLSPHLGYGLMDFFNSFPLPPDAAVDLTVSPMIEYLGNNQYRVRFFLKDPHDISQVTLRRDIPSVFNRNLRIAGSQLSQIYGPDAASMYPGLARIRRLIRAEQLDPTTVDLIIEVSI